MLKQFACMFVLFGYSATGAAQDVLADAARRNGDQAQEALVRSRAVLRAYLQRRDAVTGLLPRKGGDTTWYVQDSAADLYPFLVMAAYYTERPLYEKDMHELLAAEIRHSMRVGRLSDNVLAGGGFQYPDINMDRIIFGSSEYAKDGLLPLTELLGRTAWFERMAGIADDLIAKAPYEGPFGPLPSLSSEVNGELLQVFTRLAYLTNDSRYIDQALAIARFYFEEVIPKSNGLPPQTWDLQQGRPASEFFNFADHGNEIVGGLSELVLYLKLKHHPSAGTMAESLSKLVHLLLDIGLNEDGVWYSRVSWADHHVLDARHAHCWGYLFNGVYTAWVITEEARFLEAVKRALAAVTSKPEYLDDPAGSGRKYGSNAYSDALESAIVFLNRLPDARYFEVLDTCVARFLKRQREDGIIEDWYGDGNYVRTALMYALMKSQGAWIEPWRDDVKLGAAADGSGVKLVLQAAQPWEGILRFDRPRHRLYFNMSVNYPRLNEFPEWFTVEGDALYRVERNNETEEVCGGQLAQGLPVRLDAGQEVVLRVAPLQIAGHATPASPPQDETHHKFVTVADTRFLDAAGRQVLLHGLNVISKDPKSNYQSWHGPKEFQQMREWGMNCVRLGILWDGIEPSPGQFDEHYLDKVEERVAWAADAGLYVLLDMHQDLFSVLYSDGATAWATLSDHQPHVAPGTVWSDAYMTSPAVQHAFDNFWKNAACADGVGVQDHFARAWRHVAERFADHPAVIGYDLLNEPNIGSRNVEAQLTALARLAALLTERGGGEPVRVETLVEKYLTPAGRSEVMTLLKERALYEQVIDAARPIFEQFEREQLMPMFQRVADAIRAVDQNHILFLETSVSANMGIPTAIGPLRGPNGERDPRQAYAPHGYDIVVDTADLALASPERVDLIFGHHGEAAARLNMPMLVGEWGAYGAAGPEILPAARHMARQFERLLCGDTYWEYGQYVLNAAYLEILQRPLPQRVAGRLLQCKTDPDAGEFECTWLEAPEIASPTCVYLPERWYAGEGAVEIVPHGAGYSISHPSEAERSVVVSIAPVGKPGERSLRVRSVTN
ncbi:MAG: cellulase family glycosylhydrolase [Candidatus Hydrogenedentes bacterium]|nr:cellulase family glycosylhydrolase [Candidatus Hydrogenedentota bacterium]